MAEERGRYADVAAVGRDVLREANRAELSVRDRKVLDAIFAFTVLYSRLKDHVYLAQLAAFAFGVEEAKAWMTKKTRESLVRLRDAGLIVCEAPRGRPGMSTGGPRYLVGLAAMHPDTGVTYDEEMHPDTGVTSPEKSTPDLDRKAPRIWTESDPEAWGPTEKTSEKNAEERAAAPTVVDRARDLVRRTDLHHEVHDEVGHLSSQYGAQQVAAAIEALHEAGHTFRYPSELAKAAVDLLRRPTTSQPRPRHECDLCRDDPGLVLEDVEDEHGRRTLHVRECPNVGRTAA